MVPGPGRGGSRGCVMPSSICRRRTRAMPKPFVPCSDVVRLIAAGDMATTAGSGLSTFGFVAAASDPLMAAARRGQDRAAADRATLPAILRLAKDGTYLVTGGFGRLSWPRPSGWLQRGVSYPRAAGSPRSGRVA